jgi:hypothetical protein
MSGSQAMNKPNVIITMAILAVLAVAPHQAAAEQKSGKFVFDTYVTWRFIKTLDMGGVGSAQIVEGDGFNKLVEGSSPNPYGFSTFRCIAVFQQIGEKFTDKGSCVETDKDGDIIYATFDDTDNVYRGGTGKYKGLTGTYDATPIYRHLSGDRGAELIIRHQTQWEIK